MANKTKHKTPEAKALAAKKAMQKYNAKRSQLSCYIDDKALITQYAEAHDLTFIDALHKLLEGASNDSK